MDRYEKALAKARAGKSLEEIFPELKESEDERIRNEIIEFIQWSVDRHFMREDFHQAKRPSEWIAYLEKQKAKERLNRMAPIYNNKESFESALEKAWKYYNESASRTVDSFEDDYIECVFSKGFREGFLYREKQKEQKPITHENDFMSKPKTSLEILKHYLIWAENSEEDCPYTWKELAAAIKDAISALEQKPAEWNEKDNIMFENITLCLKEYCLTDEINWLKSLRPKPHWKPSEGQMTHLERCFSHGHTSQLPNQHVLESLYNDLKKLM